MTAPADTPTFADLARLDPRLHELEVLARSCRRQDWWRVVRPRLFELVGWHRRDGHPVLSTEWAYDVVVDHIAALLR